MKETEKPKEQIVKSTLLQAYSYDAQNLTLSVSFRDGTNIDYFNVPPPVMSGVFDRPGSIGSRFMREIAGGKYKWTKTG